MICEVLRVGILHLLEFLQTVHNDLEVVGHQLGIQLAVDLNGDSVLKGYLAEPLHQ